MDYLVPGVYRQAVVRTAPARLPTGVPGFVGCAGSPPDPLAPAQALTPVATPVALQRKEDFARAFRPVEGSFLADAVAGFFDNGGERCYVVRTDADPAGDPARVVAGLVQALAALGPLADLDLVAVPDAMALDAAQDSALVQCEVLRHCASHGNRFAILDARREATPEAVEEQRDALAEGAAEPVNGALYYPWVAQPGPARRMVPPSGHVAGIYARTDAKAGVFKAPANEELLGIADIEWPLDADAQARLNPGGVNCLRPLPGRGIRVWGARTLSRQDEWRYVNVRRLFLTVHRWIDLHLAWASFEPNDARLWNRIRRELEAYLSQLWRAGAFAGETPGEAFFVRCDAETNPPESRELGRVVSEIGLAPAAPAEFIVVRITQQATAAA